MSKNTISTIMERRSIRNYRPDPIPEEHIEQILEAGRQAPSAGNRQPWHFVVVRDSELRKKDSASLSRTNMDGGCRADRRGDRAT